MEKGCVERRGTITALRIRLHPLLLKMLSLLSHAVVTGEKSRAICNQPSGSRCS